MNDEQTTTVVGEIRCLGCGRTLAEAVRREGASKLRLRPAPYQSAVQVRRAEGGSLYCLRCNGRAFFEPLTSPIPVSSFSRNTLQRVS